MRSPIFAGALIALLGGLAATVAATAAAEEPAIVAVTPEETGDNDIWITLDPSDESDAALQPQDGEAGDIGDDWLAPAPTIPEDLPEPSPTAAGYQGIWFTLGQFGDYGDKYSGGLGTYTAKHRPLAVYESAANKTFFVYGGARDGERYLLCMIGEYDHATGEVSRPVIVHDKEGVNDPHDNPSLSVDAYGHLWVFVSGRGQRRPGFIYRSVLPHDTRYWEQVEELELTYPQPYYVRGQGFAHFFTKYTRGRELYFNSSPDGFSWTDTIKLAGMGGHYQVSDAAQGRIFTAFNFHPGGNVDKRTNLYYIESNDFGRTWRTVDGQEVAVPIEDTHSPSLIHDYRYDRRLVYVKDIDLDGDGNPVVLYVTSASHFAGPPGDPRYWSIAHWNGSSWDRREITTTTHNYDMGSLYVEDDPVWRIIAPTEAGPQPMGTGGEMALWISEDRGQSWRMERRITQDSAMNHKYARRPQNAHEDFYAFWADGNPDEYSDSNLYFTNKQGDAVYRLPRVMDGDWAAPERVE